MSSVRLVTLSACETAIGGIQPNDREGLEIAGVSSHFLDKVSSVMATLWKVGDDSTRQLMVQFYRQLASSGTITQAEALQQAQLFLLHGGTPGKQERGGLVFEPLPDAKPSPEASSNYVHPYYWSPFILIDNSL